MTTEDREAINATAKRLDAACRLLQSRNLSYLNHGIWREYLGTLYYLVNVALPMDVEPDESKPRPRRVICMNLVPDEIGHHYLFSWAYEYFTGEVEMPDGSKVQRFTWVGYAF